LTERIIGAAMDVHRALVKSTLKAAGLEVGLLINFNVAVLKDGIKRIVLTKIAPK
jgi:hypothetical protein